LLTSACKSSAILDKDDAEEVISSMDANCSSDADATFCVLEAEYSAILAISSIEALTSSALADISSEIAETFFVENRVIILIYGFLLSIYEIDKS
jgi:hypothetical protein